MNYYEDGPAAIKADHECTYDSRGIEWCPICYTQWPCEVYQIADRIEQQDDNAQNSRAVTVTINTARPAAINGNTAERVEAERDEACEAILRVEAFCEQMETDPFWLPYGGPKIGARIRAELRHR